MPLIYLCTATEDDLMNDDDEPYEASPFSVCLIFSFGYIYFIVSLFQQSLEYKKGLK